MLLNLDKQMPAGADLDLCEILLSSAELLPQNYPYLTTLYKAAGFLCLSTSICSSLNTLSLKPRDSELASDMWDADGILS